MVDPWKKHYENTGIILHDLRRRKSKAKIDPIVVDSKGIFVMDTMYYECDIDVRLPENFTVPVKFNGIFLASCSGIGKLLTGTGTYTEIEVEGASHEDQIRFRSSR